MVNKIKKQRFPRTNYKRNITAIVVIYDFFSSCLVKKNVLKTFWEK